jgi:hypothetical protein
MESVQGWMAGAAYGEDSARSIASRDSAKTSMRYGLADPQIGRYTLGGWR